MTWILMWWHLIFKTYLHKLPKPILMHALNPYFKAAMSRETNIRKSIDEQAVPTQSVSGKGLMLDLHFSETPPHTS